MSDWPVLKTARQIVEAEIVPCSEDVLKSLARTHGIGRKLGRRRTRRHRAGRLPWPAPDLSKSWCLDRDSRSFHVSAGPRDGA